MPSVCGSPPAGRDASAAVDVSPVDQSVPTKPFARPSHVRTHGKFRRVTGGDMDAKKPTRMVESRCGAVSVGRTYLFPPLSSGGALVVRPWLRFHIPLIEPDMQISRIRLSDKTSRLCFRVQRHLRFLNPLRSYRFPNLPGPSPRIASV